MHDGLFKFINRYSKIYLARRFSVKRMYNMAIVSVTVSPGKLLNSRQKSKIWKIFQKTAHDPNL